MKILLSFICLFLLGCASPWCMIKKTPTGVNIDASDKSIVKYKDENIEVEFDSKSQPLVNLSLPDVEIEK